MTPLIDRLIDALRQRGVSRMFGIPGDFALPIFDAVERCRDLSLFTFSHEPAVGFAADGAARLAGGPGVALVTYGAGALNMINAVAGAYAEKSPVVVISGAPGVHERGHALLVHHQAKSLDSQARAYREVTCDQAILNDPSRAPGEIVRVLDACLRHSRPVYIEVPRDLATVPVGPLPMSTADPIDADAVAACAEEVLARLGSARRPVLLVGVEVRRYGLEGRVARLVERLGLPVVTTFLGRGLLAHAGCGLQGTYIGLAGDPTIREQVEGSDALLMLGVIVCDTNFGVSARRIDTRNAILASDGEVRLAYHRYGQIPLPALLDALLERVAPLTAVDRRSPVPMSRSDGAAEGALTPDDIAPAINGMFGRHGDLPVAADAGDSLFVAMDVENADLVAPGYYAGMGFAVPAALGMQAATGRRPLVLTGDGAFQMTGWELGHCRRYGWDPLVVVLNNGGWGMLAAFRPQARYNRLGAWPIAKLARNLGGDAVRVHTSRELRTALDQAASRRGYFQLIEAMLPLQRPSSTLSRFVEVMTHAAAQPLGPAVGDFEARITETGGSSWPYRQHY